MGRTSHNFRLDDDVFAAARQRAWYDRRTITDVVEAALREYGSQPAPEEGPRAARPGRSREAAAETSCPHRGIRPGAYCKACESTVPR